MNLALELKVPSLSEFGITEKDVQVVAEKAGRASSMKANPVVFTLEELEKILLKAL